MQSSAPIRKGGRLRISEIYASVQGEGLLTGTPSVFVRTSGCNLRCWFCDTPFASWHPEGDWWAIGDILRRVQSFELNHVVLTGGEPMLDASVIELCRVLHAGNYHITIETAGTIDRLLPCDLMSISPKLSGSAPFVGQTTPVAGIPELPSDLAESVSVPGSQLQASGSPHSASASHDGRSPTTGSNGISPRWVNQHHVRRDRPDIVEQLIQRHTYQLKFVVDNVADAEEVLEYVVRLDGCRGERVLLMPQGTDETTLQRQAEWLLPWCQKHGLRFCERAHIRWYGNVRGT